MKLLRAVERYFTFLREFSTAGLEGLPISFATLFAPSCRKIVNGRVVSENREQLRAQLLEAKADFINHTIEPIKMLWDITLRVAVGHFKLLTVDCTYIVTTLLTCDEQGRIVEINDVYNEVGAYN